MFKLSQIVITKLRGNNTAFPLLKCDKYLKSTIAETPNIYEPEPEEEPKKLGKTRNNMVAAVFASLHPINVTETDIKTPITDNKIIKARSINELLSISEGNGVSRRHALKVVSTLAEWSSSGKAKLTDFENDARFIRLCRILSKGNKINRNMISRSEDLSVILNVTADDEAARLVANLNVEQLVKVVRTLTVRKRRSVLLLRSLAYNISASPEQLNLKQSSDLLYSMCVLNFIDDNLFAKICADVINELNSDFKKSSVVGSIITSLGLLKYKNCEVLDGLSHWMLKNHSTCRVQDLFSLFTTLATVNYLPSNSDDIFNVVLPQLTLNEATKPLMWLNFVWALVVLNRASPDHVSSVLREDFVDRIDANNVAAKCKLLNINGAAVHLLRNYDDVTLSATSSAHNVTIVQTKEKTDMADAVVETLKNLIHSDEYLNRNVNTGLGFTIDAKCLLDKKCHPLPITEENEARHDVIKVAILAYDYHSMCRGKVENSGANVLAQKLLEAQNYKVLDVPYVDFKLSDKLVYRVKYLESRLKDVVK